MWPKILRTFFCVFFLKSASDITFKITIGMTNLKKISISKIKVFNKYRLYDTILDIKTNSSK